MKAVGPITFILLPQEDFEMLKATQTQILEELRNFQKNIAASAPVNGYLTAIEFMKAVKICRSKFDQLASANKIRIVKKKRKIYVPVTEVERYFTDPAVQ